MTTQNILDIFSKYDIEPSYFRKNYTGFVATVLQFCEQNNIQLNKKNIFSKEGISGNTYLHYYCECGELAKSPLSGFTKKTVFACKKCNAGKINKIFKTISSDEITKTIKNNGFDVVTIPQSSSENNIWTLQCSFGHQFDVHRRSLKKITNCPHCYKSSIEEEYVRNLVEHHFQKSFPNTRPSWLINPETGFNLELDLYNQELSLAIEYHGPQHSLPIFGEDRLNKSIRNDNARRNVCSNHNVKLIEINFPSSKLSKIEFLQYVSDELHKHNIFISNETIQFALNKEVFSNKTGAIIDNIKTKINESNKTFVSCFYENSNSHVFYKCNICQNQHSTPSCKISSLTKNSCPSCVQLKKTEKAIQRHTEIVMQICNQFNFEYVSFLKNKAGHVTGFKYLQDNKEFLFGIKKYRKYLQTHDE